MTDMIAPEESIQYSTTNPTLKRAQQRWEYVRECKFEKDWREQMKKDLGYFTGDDQGWDEEGARAKLKEQNKPAVSLNNIAPIFRLIMGSRPTADSRFMPTEGNDTETADILNACKDHIFHINRWQFMEDEWFKHGLLKMRSVVSILPDYSIDPRGEPKMKLKDGTRIWCDPNSQEKDRNDGEYLFEMASMTPEQSKRTWPRQAEYIDSLVGSIDSAESSGASVQRRNPDDYDDNFSASKASYYDKAKNQLNVLYYWYKEHGRITRIVDLASPGTPEIWDSPKPAAEVKAELAAISPGALERLHVVETDYVRVFYMVFCHDVIFEQDVTPWERRDGQRTFLSDNFPLVIFEPERLIAGSHDELTSLVKPLHDPQKYHNKLASAILHIIGTTANSGWEYEDGAISPEEEEKLKKWGSTPGVTLKWNTGAISGAKTRKIQPNVPPQAHMLYAKEMADSLLNISGVESLVNIDSLGKSASGMAVDLKQRQGGNIIAWVYKSFRFFQYILAEYIRDACQTIYDYEKVINIRGSRPRQVRINEQIYDEVGGITQVLNDVTTGSFDVVIADKDVLPTMRMERFKQFVELVRNGALPLPPPVLLKVITTLLDDPELREVVESEMQNLQQMMPPAGGKTPGAPQVTPPAEPLMA